MIRQIAHRMALAFLLFWPCDAWAEETLPYQPQHVVLSGTIALEGLYGPPGFGKSPDTDTWSVFPVLKLDAPISVMGDKDTESLNHSTFQHVTKLQIAALPSSTIYVNENKHVKVHGTLFQKRTDYHITDVLIAVESIEPITITDKGN